MYGLAVKDWTLMIMTNKEVSFFTGGPDFVCDLHTVCDSIALCFEPFKRMYENGSKIALNSTCSKGFK